MSIITTAIDVLKTKNEITQVELVESVHTITGKSKESIRGCFMGYDSKHKLFGTDYFKAEWDRCIDSVLRRKGTVHKSKVLNGAVYDTEEKTKVRNDTLKYVKGFKKGNILTMAGINGFCVKLFKELSPLSVVHNCEKFESVLKEYEKKGLDTINFLGGISKYLRNNIKYNFINYDSIGYLCDYMYSDFKYINDNKLTKYISITLDGVKKIRNTGKFANDTRNKYKNSADPTLDCLLDTMSNYKLIDNIWYGGSMSKKRNLVFKRSK